MKKSEYSNMKSMAYYSGLSGLELKEIQYGINDYLIVESGSWCSKKSIHRLKVNYDKNGNDYIKLNGYKIPLNEFIRM